MSASTRVRFRDLDMVLSTDIFLVTLFGMILAYVFGALDVTWINLENLFGFPVAPTTLVLNMAILLIVVGYTKNLGSTVLVSLATAMGMTNSFGSDSIALFETYLGVLLISSIMVGYLVSKFSQIVDWSLFFLIHSLIFLVFTMTLGHFVRVEASKYWGIGVNLGIGGSISNFEIDLLGGSLPLFDIIVSFFAILFVLLTFLRLKSKDIYSSDAAAKLSIFGTSLIVLGFLATLIPAILYSSKIVFSDLDQLSTPFLLEPLFDLFTRSSNASAIISPGNIFFSALISSVLFNIGILLRMVAKKKDTLAWSEGSYDMVLIAPSIFVMIFILLGLKPVQELTYRGGWFFGQELLPIYFTEIWISFIWNGFLAWIALSIMFKLKTKISDS